jgi:hypothetical protein
MKKAKVLVNINYKDVFYPKDLILLESTAGVGNYYYSGNKNIETDFIVKNPDIFELIKEEPQEEEIEGIAYTCCEKHIGFFLKNNRATEQKEIPARLILNPKPKKEYVRWVMKEFIDNLKTGHPIYLVLATESDYEKYCHKIKITVEEE